MIIDYHEIHHRWCLCFWLVVLFASGCFSETESLTEVVHEARCIGDIVQLNWEPLPQCDIKNITWTKQKHNDDSETQVASRDKNFKANDAVKYEGSESTLGLTIRKLAPEDNDTTYKVQVHCDNGDSYEGSSKITVYKKTRPGLLTHEKRVSSVSTCVGMTATLNWTYVYESECRDEPKEIRWEHSDDPVLETNKRFHSTKDPNGTILTIHDIKDADGGSYTVKLIYNKKLYLTSPSTDLKIEPAATIHPPDESTFLLCENDPLKFTWTLERGSCTSEFVPVVIFEDNKNYSERTEFEENKTSFTVEFKRILLTKAGNYTLKLRSTKEPSLIYANDTVEVHVTNKPDECTGKKYKDSPLHVTRNHEDVTAPTGAMVKAQDVLLVSIDIPAPEFSWTITTRFFWMEMHHKTLKTYFGKRCYGSGICSIEWRVSKRSPGIFFDRSEQSREVKIGVSIEYMYEKFQYPNRTFYFRNHKLDEKVHYDLFGSARHVAQESITLLVLACVSVNFL